MTTYTDALVTIDEIVEGMFLKGDHPEGHEARMKQMCLDGYRELNLIVLPCGNAQEKFTMDSNYIIYMPQDMMLVNNVSVPYDGKKWTLTLEKDMIPTTSELNGAEVLDSDDGEGVDLTKKGTNYAARGGVNNEGYYYPDYVKRRILFRNVSRSEVLVDYLTTGIDLKETTYVPAYARMAVEAHVRLYMELNKTMPNPNVVAIFRDEYERQKSVCRGIKFNMTDFMDAIYRSHSATVYRGHGT